MKPRLSLLERFPNIARQWHPIKNGTLTPDQVSYGSNRMVWWKCSKGPDHEWPAIIKSRTGRTLQGCGVCAGKRVVKSNSLATKYPAITTQWHPTKNGAQSPTQFTYGSSKSVWWLCPKAKDHAWKATIASRTVNGQNCGVCSGKIVVESTSFAHRFPKLALEWHPKRNRKLKSSDVSWGSGKVVWWQCPKGEDHEWEAPVKERIDGHGCPVCRGLKVVRSNSLLTVNPKIAAQWHPKKNGALTPAMVTVGSSLPAWWVCSIDTQHIWKTAIVERKLRNCPYCAGKQVLKSDSLFARFPRLCREWHSSKNGELRPNEVTITSARRVWWQCEIDKSHIWRSAIKKRTGYGGKQEPHSCPFCRTPIQSKKQLALAIALQKVFPEIKLQDHVLKLNGKPIFVDIYASSCNLIVEYDGSYWHRKRRNFDILKSELLRKAGYNLIRVRVRPLERIHRTDIRSLEEEPTTETFLRVLKRICSICRMPRVARTRANKYLSGQAALDIQNIDSAVRKYLAANKRAK